MGHAVHYRTSAGETRFEEADSLDAALDKVERLRNDDGVSDVRVYREIPIAFKAYYKVTVAEDATPGSTPDSPPPDSPPPGAMPLAAPVPPPAKVSEEAVESEDAKRSSLFSRG
jgi:hypothetical protein